LDRGRRVREILKQAQFQPLAVAEQIAALVAVNEGVLDPIAIEDIGDAERKIRRAMTEDRQKLAKKIDKGDKLDQHDIAAIRQTAENAVKRKQTSGKKETQAEEEAMP
jgi:F-type H+-transporting ATPase subunit alpha